MLAAGGPGKVKCLMRLGGALRFSPLTGIKENLVQGRI
jgi:hypothetical protein